MTPLALRLYRDTTRPIAARQHRGEVAEWVGARLLETHFFECSGIFWQARELFGGDPAEAGLSGEEMLEALSDLAYLPAPLTWLEWEWDGGKRTALLLAEQADGRCFAVLIAEPTEDAGLMFSPLGMFGLGERCATPFSHYRGPGATKADGAQCFVWDALLLLNMINRPKLCDGIERPLNFAAAQKLRRAGVPGRFPLRGYTEITLRVGPQDGGREPKQGFATGDRPLHFVRKHKRRVWGAWTEIPAHWRGDAELGMKRSRYVAKPAPGFVPRVARLPREGGPHP